MKAVVHGCDRCLQEVRETVNYGEEGTIRVVPFGWSDPDSHPPTPVLLCGVCTTLWFDLIKQQSTARQVFLEQYKLEVAVEESPAEPVPIPDDDIPF